MTSSEYLNLCKKMFSYSPYSTKPAQQLFLRTIQKNAGALEEAQGFFPTGDTLYKASNNALNRFITYYYYGSGTKEELKRNIAKDATKIKK